MDLRTFITETLCQISDGMIDAQAALKDKGVRINPPYEIDENGRFRCVNENSQHFQSIEFDIALTTSAKSNAEGGFSIEIWGAKLGGDKGKEAKAEAVSRVRFTIAAMLPQDIRDPKVISAPNLGGDFVA